MNERTIDLGDIEVSVAEAGVGQRPFLLIHGFTGAKEDFTRWLDPLADAGWHAVAPDVRGHGSSSKPDNEDSYSLDIFGDDAIRLLDALAWERFALLGHSMGGMVAQLVAQAIPERLEALILMDTGHGPVKGLDPTMVEAAISIVRSKGIDALADAIAGNENPLETPAHRRLLAEQPDHAEFDDRKFRAASPAMYASMASAMTHTTDRLDRLKEFPASLPALVIVGTEDRPFIRSSERMATAIPTCSLVEIPDAGHSPQFENPEAWWRAVSGFLAEVRER